MKLKPATVFEIVRLIDLQPPGQTGFCMLVTSSGEPEFIADLRDELDVQMSGSLGVVDVGSSTAMGLLEKLRTGFSTAVLVHGFDTWSDDQFASLDINRSRMETGAFLLFSVDSKTAGRFLDRAPNIRSYIGSNIFVLAPDTSLMGPSEIAERLDQLRAHYRLSDAEVIEQAANGALPPEPHFVEWLVLVGRSELVR